MISGCLSQKSNKYCRVETVCGFTLIEFALVAAIVGVLAGALLNRIVFYQRQAELVAVQQMVGALRSAMHLQVAKLYVSNRQAELPVLVEQNPMSWLAEKPGNYAGEYFSSRSQEIAPGNWYFDRTEKTLVYLLNDGNNNFQDSRSAMLKFKIKLSITAGKNFSSPTTIEGIVLDQVSD